MIQEEYIVKQLKDILPDLLQENGLEQIKQYLTYQPYYLEEFPSLDTTPALSVYRVKDMPEDIGWTRQISIDLFVYYDKTLLIDVNRNVDDYEKIIIPVIEKNCIDLDIIDISFPTYVDTGNFYLKGFQVLSEARGIDITRRL